MSSMSTVMKHGDKLPWYKQPLVWMVIAIPASAILAGIPTVYFAVSTEDGLVVDDYYKHGKTINRLIEKEQRAAALGLNASVMIRPDNGYIEMQFDKGAMPEYPASVQIALRHVTQQRQDSQVTLYKSMDNRYAGSLASAIREGIWIVEISGGEAEQTWRIASRNRIKGATSLEVRHDAYVQPVVESN